MLIGWYNLQKSFSEAERVMVSLTPKLSYPLYVRKMLLSCLLLRNQKVPLRLL